MMIIVFPLRQVHHPRIGDDQDTGEASDQGRQEGDLWEAHHGEGEACQDRGQGLLCCSFEEEHLSLLLGIRDEWLVDSPPSLFSIQTACRADCPGCISQHVRKTRDIRHGIHVGGSEVFDVRRDIVGV